MNTPIAETAPRALRAALFTVLAVTLSTTSHVLLSGAPLPLPTVALVTATVFALAWSLATRERSFGRIAALLVPLELAADTVFTAGQHVCYGGPVAGPLRTVGVDLLCGGGALGAPLARLLGAPAETPAAFTAHPRPELAWLLLGAHVGVGLLAAAWLRYGERALAQLLRAAAAQAFRPLALAVARVPAPHAPRTARLRPEAAPAGRPALLIAHSVGLRGPPAGLLPA
ncbi:hypothetical protein ACPCVL_10225 [Streptomyces koyangensis]|uniref:hypothetical protein n=1 Tax=Streptomyces koyangensis TaxID=188770 RepID=UPI003C2AFE82